MTRPSTLLRRALAAAAALLLVACGADGDSPRPAAPQAAAPPFDTVTAAPMSATEHDRLLAAAFDGSNRLYAAGWVAEGTDQALAVTRYGADGALDTSFGTAGVASVNVARGGKAAELARGVVVQPSGKVVISGVAEHDPTATGDGARDTDVVLARFDESGRLDAGFGTGGAVRLDLSTGVAEGSAYRSDTSWGLTALPDGKLLVVAGQVAPGRTDLDFAVVRLTADGTKDTTFGEGGVALVGVAPGVSETPRSAVLLPDGRAVVAGYAAIDGLVKTILFALTPSGALDPSFGTGGTAVHALLGNVGEAYAVGVLGNGRIVTTGYGKDTAEAKVDLIAGGFTPTGAVDPAHGSNGLLRVDVAGEDDRGRHLAITPDGGALLVGSGKPSATNLDAMVVRLARDGTLQDRRLVDLGGPNDAFFGVAVSPDGSRAAAVGYVGQDTSDSSKNDDGAILWLRT
ncbi:MAG: hypothetical protein ACLGI2_10395 [Acidimicrobiia bacterium]